VRYAADDEEGEEDPDEEVQEQQEWEMDRKDADTLKGCDILVTRWRSGWPYVRVSFPWLHFFRKIGNNDFGLDCHRGALGADGISSRSTAIATSFKISRGIFLIFLRNLCTR
jgi:hypothetical protein